MASNDAEPTVDYHSLFRLIECKVCSNKPARLEMPPCQHTICHNCVVKITEEGDGVFKCPECRTEYQNTKFPKCLMAEQIMEACKHHPTYKTAKNQCHLCSEDVVCICETCETFLCHTCGGKDSCKEDEIHSPVALHEMRKRLSVPLQTYHKDIIHKVKSVESKITDLLVEKRDMEDKENKVKALSSGEHPDDLEWITACQTLLEEDGQKYGKCTVADNNIRGKEVQVTRPSHEIYRSEINTDRKSRCKQESNEELQQINLQQNNIVKTFDVAVGGDGSIDYISTAKHETVLREFEDALQEELLRDSHFRMDGHMALEGEVHYDAGCCNVRYGQRVTLGEKYSPSHYAYEHITQCVCSESTRKSINDCIAKALLFTLCGLRSELSDIESKLAKKTKKRRDKYRHLMPRYIPSSIVI